MMSRFFSDGLARRVVLSAFVLALVASVAAAAQRVDGIRRLPLEGAPNVRDIGGYVTTDGRHVEWREVYRSGAVGRATDKDYEYLAGVGIAVVCDFRNEGERRAAPTVWRGPNPPELIWLPAASNTGSGASSTSARALIASGASPAEVAASMRASYEQYIV